MQRRKLTMVTLMLLLAGACSGSDSPPDTDEAPLRSTGRVVESGRYRFAEVTRSLGLRGEPRRTWGVIWADFDRDGDPDLIQGNHFDPAPLYVNDGGTYTETRPHDLTKKGVDRHACAWGEANGDGRPDLYCAVGANKGTGTGLNQLLIQQLDGGLTDEAERYGVRDKFGRGRTVDWLDHDGDGDLDLLIGNMARAGHPSKLFDNTDLFTDAASGLGDSFATLAASWADFDNDGDPDVLMTSEPAGAARLYENLGGRLRRLSVSPITTRNWRTGTWGDFDGDGWIDLHLVGKARGMVLRNDRGKFNVVDDRPLKKGASSVWFDAENDGDLDLYVVQGAVGGEDKYHRGPESKNFRDLLLINRKNGFERLEGLRLPEPRKGHGQSVAAADHNRDGRVDLFVTNGNYHWRSTNRLYENRSRASNFVAVELAGAAANPWGLGARLRARAGGRTYHRQITDAFSYQSQSDPGYAHFGIGSAEGAFLRVIWPDGTRDCLAIEAGEIVRVARGEFGCP